MKKIYYVCAEEAGQVSRDTEHLDTAIEWLLDELYTRYPDTTEVEEKEALHQIIDCDKMYKGLWIDYDWID